MHSAMKLFLHSSTEDLLRTVQAIKLMLLTMHHEFRQQLASQRDRIPFNMRPEYIPIFPANVNTYITPKALLLVKEQWKLALNGEHALQCSESFTKVYGLPCCHEIRT
jgi:hypothetical protein